MAAKDLIKQTWKIEDHEEGYVKIRFVATRETFLATTIVLLKDNKHTAKSDVNENATGNNVTGTFIVSLRSLRDFCMDFYELCETIEEKSLHMKFTYDVADHVSEIENLKAPKYGEGFKFEYITSSGSSTNSQGNGETSISIKRENDNWSWMEILSLDFTVMNDEQRNSITAAYNRATMLRKTHKEISDNFSEVITARRRLSRNQAQLVKVIVMKALEKVFPDRKFPSDSECKDVYLKLDSLFK